MTTPTPDAIEAAEAAVRKYYSMGGWVRTADVAKLAVQAAYPLMEAQAKAEALTEAAEYIDAGDFADMNPDGTMRTRLTQVQISQNNRDVTVRWLRARAATIEGKDS